MIRGKSLQTLFEMKSSLKNQIESEIVERSELIKKPIISGVYFLINKDRIVYVGKSLNVRYRISQHREEKTKKFDRFYCLSYGDEFINAQKEIFYIKFFKPKYNIKHK